MTIQEVRDSSGRRQQARHGSGPTMILLVGGVRGLASVGSCCQAPSWACCSDGRSISAGREGHRGWRWLALSPLLFSSVLFSRPGDMASMFEDGIGGGAIGVPLIGMVGGYALSGRGPVWARIASGVVALAAIPVWAITATSVGGPALALDTPLGAWVALYYSFLAVLALACAIPHRAAAPQHAA